MILIYICTYTTNYISKFKIMARLPQGILGGISGKVGNVIGSSWKGIPIIKSRPLSVSNPKTSGQIAQRTKMSNVVAFAKLILAAIIKPLWDRFAQQASGYNEFVSANIDLFVASLASPAADLVISKGQMVAVNPAALATSSGSAQVTASWLTTLLDALALASDLVYIVVVNETQGNIAFVSGTEVRAGASVQFDMPTVLAQNDVMHTYLAFRRADGTIVSNTGYRTDTVA